MDRNDTLFSIRYAIRVLERHARLCRIADALLRLCAIFSGSAAFAALMAGRPAAVAALGALFALLQAAEFALRPAELAAKSMAMRQPYARLLADACRMDDVALEAAYLALVAEDDVVVPHWLREVAYNDVLVERGCDPEEAFSLSRWQRFVAYIG